MVTTRGRRTSSVLEEPLSQSPRKKKVKEEQQPAVVQENQSEETTSSRLRKRRSGATDALTPSTSRSPETKRIKREPSSLSPGLTRDSRTPSPTTTRKSKSRKVKAVEENSIENTHDGDKNDEAVDEEQPLGTVVEEAQESVLPANAASPQGTNGIKDPSEVLSEDNEALHIQPPNHGPPDPQDTLPEKEDATTSDPPATETMSSTEDIIAQAAKAAQEALRGISQSNSEEAPSYHQNPYDPYSIQNPVQHHTSQQAPESATGIPSVPENQSINPQTPSSFSQSNNELAINQLPQSNDPPYLQKHQQTQIPQQTYYQGNTSTGYGPPGQSQPTAVLYERARQVANSKSSNVSRNKQPNVSQRRPWTVEEEQALMDGLDQVKGPHWSQILVLYGPGGSINETLRDRTQVQLKDKARNLKLFFLKSKIEVPYYLSFVTGELKSRAPSHVSTYDDTPPRPIGMPNGISGSTTSRNRVLPPSAQATHSALFNPILQLPQSNGTYSSPYAAIPGSQPPPTNEAESNENADNDEASHQNIADLADSAAAQVAAALANFNALDLPNFGASTSIGPDAEKSVETDPAERTPSDLQNVSNENASVPVPPQKEGNPVEQ